MQKQDQMIRAKMEKAVEETKKKQWVSVGERGREGDGEREGKERERKRD